LTSCEGEKTGGILPSDIVGKGADSLFGDEMTDAAGMTLAFLARRRIKRSDRAYLPAGTIKSESTQEKARKSLAYPPKVY
jgi:hypothetical protein